MPESGYNNININLFNNLISSVKEIEIPTLNFEWFRCTVVPFISREKFSVWLIDCKYFIHINLHCHNLIQYKDRRKSELN